MKVCPVCGSTLTDDALFCSKCGTKLAAPVEPAAPVFTAPPVQPEPSVQQVPPQYVPPQPQVPPVQQVPPQYVPPQQPVYNQPPVQQVQPQFIPPQQPVQQVPPQYITPQQEPKKPVDKKKITLFAIIGAAAAVVIALAIILPITLSNGTGYKGTANKFMKAVFSADAKTVMKYIPDYVIRDSIDSGYSRSEMAEDMRDMLEEVQEEMYDMSLYGRIKVIPKAINVRKVSRSDVRDMNDCIENWYGRGRIQEAAIVTVKITVKSGGMKQSMPVQLVVVKEDGKYKVDTEGDFYRILDIDNSFSFYDLY